MAAIIALVTALLAKIPGVIGDYFKAKHDLAKLKIETEKDIELAKQKASGEIAVAELELAKTALSATGKRFKYFTFVMWFGPFMLGIVYPPGAKAVFENLSFMPEWYVQSCITIMFTVWGIAVSAPIISNIFSGVSRFFAQHREFKIERARMSKKEFFEALRSIQGFVSGDDVRTFDKVLDRLSKKS